MLDTTFGTEDGDVTKQAQSLPSFAHYCLNWLDGGTTSETAGADHGVDPYLGRL